MRFTQDLTSTVNVIRGYGGGEIRINDTLFRDSVIVAAAAIRTQTNVRSVTDLTAEHAARILELEPELVLIGSGRWQVFPDAAFAAGFLQSGIGFETMDTGAACRTFNVLVGEQRRVVALLLI